MALTPGTRLGVYEVTAQIGEGGMGQVYRATDTKLKRAVAIKILPPSVAADHDRLARFQREAEVLASLNHPNIAGIYGIEETNGSQALIMELVEGEDLSALIARGPIPISDVLPLARQIADGLEAAHEQGIIHRDLKPANIKVRADGAVKVLDFGLAKAMDPAGASGASASALANSPTLTSPAMTQLGMILGTAAYMSPEQARGKTVDKRADIWAFGVVLYEMLSGTRAFLGEDISDTLVSILRDDPDWSKLPADLPASTRQVLRVCLEKDPKRRVRDISDIRLALDGAFDPPATAASAVLASRRSGWRQAWPWMAGTFVIGGLAVALGIRLQSAPAPAPRVARFVVEPSTDFPFRTATSVGTIAISPDGSRLVYKVFPEGDPTSPNAVLYQRELGQLSGRLIPGTEGAQGFFFSPDGTWIGFNSAIEHTLKRISVSGGSSQTICALDGSLRGASWAPDNTIVLATNLSKGLMRVSANGGVPEALTKVATGAEESDHWWPEVLPGGKGVIFTAFNSTPERSRIMVLALPSGTISEVVRGGTQAHLSSTGHLVYAVGGTLRAVRLDVDKLRTVGDPVSILDNVSAGNSGVSNYSLAADGSLFYVRGPGTRVPPRTLVWVDRRGHQEAINAPPRAYTYARLSPDGTRVALDARDQENDIWIWDFARGTLQRLTTDPGLNRMPVWSPDGSRVAFTAERDGVESIFWQHADGSGAPERLSVGSTPAGPQSFSPDGKQLIFDTPLSGPFDEGVLSVDNERRADLLLKTKFSEGNGVVSPDGRWLAYQSDESEKNEVYVAPFPDVNARKTPASTGGGTRPLWSRDGRELFYYVAPDTIMAVPVTPGPNLALGKPVVAVKGPYAFPLNAGRHYDVSPDGQRFLLLVDAPTADGQKPEPPEMVLVLNWIEELKAKLPPAQ